jgi:hypothetical protein
MLGLTGCLGAVGCHGGPPGGGQTQRAATTAASCQALDGLAGSYVHPAYHARSQNRADWLPDDNREAPPPGVGLFALTILPDGRYHSAAWVQGRRQKYLETASGEVTAVQLGDGTDVTFTPEYGGIFRARAMVGETGGLELLGRMPALGTRKTKPGLLLPGASVQLSRSDQTALCKESSQCESLFGRRAKCVTPRPFADFYNDIHVCADTSQMPAEKRLMARDELAGSYVQEAYAGRRFDRSQDGLPREGVDVPTKEPLAMLTLEPDGGFHELIWTNVKNSSERVTISGHGRYDVVVRNNSRVLVLSLFGYNSNSRALQPTDSGAIEGRFALTMDGDRLTLTALDPDPNDFPTHIKPGETFHLIVNKDAVMCSHTSDCMAHFANGRKFTCEADSLFTAGWCVDVRHVGTREPPRLTELAGSYMRAANRDGYGPNDLVVSTKGDSEVGLRMLTLLPTGRFHAMVTTRSVGGGPVPEQYGGRYEIEHRGGQTLLRLTSRVTAMVVRVDSNTDDALTLTAIEADNAFFPGVVGHTVSLAKTDRSALCKTVDDCAILSMTNPRARWLCEQHSVALFREASVCVDAAERGHEDVPAPGAPACGR